MALSTKVFGYLQALAHAVERRRVSRVRVASSNTEYWTRHNVTVHRRFRSREDSFAYFRWRQLQYLFNDESLPYTGLTGKVALDYGCGPGDDLVGVIEQSQPRRLIGADISPSSLAEAEERLKLHPGTVEFLQLTEGAPIPLDDNAIDVAWSMGVLMMLPDLDAVLLELARVLRDDGVLYAMVYNRNSIWAHLYVPYIRQIVRRIDADLSFEDAFRRSTDGEACPYSIAFTPETFAAVAAKAGLSARLTGAAVSLDEMKWLSSRADAMKNQKLPDLDREFLATLTFDQYGRPVSDGVVAGVDAYYELRKHSPASA